MDPMGEVAQQAMLVSTTSRVAETTSCQTVFSTTAYDCWTTDGYTGHFRKEPCANVIKNINGYGVVLKASEWNPPEGCIRFSATSMALIEAQRAIEDAGGALWRALTSDDQTGMAHLQRLLQSNILRRPNLE